MTATRDLPELGPALGTLAEVPEPGTPQGGPAPWVGLDALRLELVSTLFELAGDARGFVLAGDRAGAVVACGRRAWLEAWDRATHQVADRFLEGVTARVRAAAAESGLPAKRLAPLLPDAEDRVLLLARLGAGAGPFVAALDRLEQAAPAASASGARGDAGFAAWCEALVAAARRLEGAWLALVEALGAAEAEWRRDEQAVRAWRRPQGVAWAISAVLLAAATALGLVLGGYVPAPAFLLPLAEWWWRTVPL